MVTLIDLTRTQDITALRRGLADGLDPNAVDEFGFSALHIALLFACNKY